MPVAARGLRGIVAAETRKSVVDGVNGVLNIVGYDINELAGKVGFEEAIYLIWNEQLPNRTQLETITSELRSQRELPLELVSFLTQVPKDAPPMDVIRTSISALGLYEQSKTSDKESPEQIRKRAASICAKLPGIVAAFHRLRNGQSIMPAREDLSEAAYFLYAMTGKEPSKDAADTLDLAYVLHIDHGFNNSAFSARVVVSTLTDIYSAVVAAIGSLKGPLHGGANEGVIPQLQEIGLPEKTAAWVDESLAHKRVVMGIGHAIYKTVDPRAKHLKQMAIKLTASLPEGKWIKIAEQIEERMKQAKGLHANVDLYSAPVYYSLGIPTDLFTPIFTIARAPGWCAHIMEQLADNRIFRPECEYIGPPVGRKVVPIEQR